MKKRTISLLLTLSMVLSVMLPCVVFSASASGNVAKLVKASDKTVTEYATIQEALDAAVDGDTVELITGVNIGDTPIKIEKSIVFDGKNNTVSYSGDDYAVWSFGSPEAESATDLELEDGTVFADKDVTIKNLKINASNTAGGFKYYYNETTLQNCSIAANGTKVAILGARNGGVLTIESGSYTAKSNAVINASAGSTLNIKDGAFVSAKSSAIYISGTAYIEGGYFETSTGSSNTIQAGSGSTLNVYGGFVINYGTGLAARAENAKDNGTKGAIYGGTFVGTGASSVVAYYGGDEDYTALTVYGGLFLQYNVVKENGKTWTLAQSYKFQDPATYATAHTGAVDAINSNRPDKLNVSYGTGGLPTVDNGAQVKLDATTGLRFTSRVAKATIDAITAFGGSNFKFGTLICPTDSLDGTLAFTAEALAAKGIAYLDIPAADGLTENADDYEFRAAVLNIKRENYSRSFSAVAYMTYEIDGHQVKLYGLYDPDTARRLSFVSSMAKNDENGGYTDYQMNLLAGFSNIKLNGNQIERYEIVYPANYTQSEYRAALAVQEYFTKRLGVTPTLRDDSTESDYEILVGKTARTSSTVSAVDYYAATVNGKKIELVAGSYIAYDELVDYFEGTLCSMLLSGIRVGEVKRAQVSKIYNGEENIITRNGGNVRVMSHNIYGWESTAGSPYNLDTRSAMLAEVYLTYMPDVLALQEYTAEMRDTTDSIINLLAAKGFAEVATGDVVSATPILYNTNALTLKSSGAEKIGDDADKYMTWAVFSVKDQLDTINFAVISVHFAYQSDANETRVAQAETVLAKATELSAANSACAVLLCGDLNSKVDSDPVQTLINGKFANTADNKVNSESISSTNSTGAPTYDESTDSYDREANDAGDKADSIDHILYYGNISYANKMSVNAFDVVTDYFATCTSDHRPLLSDIFVNDTTYTPNY